MCSGCSTSWRPCLEPGLIGLMAYNANCSLHLQACDCTMRLFEQQPEPSDGSRIAAQPAHATLLPTSTLDLEHVPPGAYALCFMCDAMCSTQPRGFRLSHMLPPDHCSAQMTNMSAVVGQAASCQLPEAPADAAAADGFGALHASTQLLQYEVQLSMQQPSDVHGANYSSMPDGTGSSNSSGSNRVDGGVAAAASSAAASSYYVWLLRLLALAVSALLMLAPEGALQRINTVGVLQRLRAACTDAQPSEMMVSARVAAWTEAKAHLLTFMCRWLSARCGQELLAASLLHDGHCVPAPVKAGGCCC